MKNLDMLMGEEGAATVRELAGDFTAAIREAEPDKADSLDKEQVRYRFDICAKWWMVLRYDMHWSKSRIRDHLGTALRMELIGLSWEPPTDRRSWVR